MKKNILLICFLCFSALTVFAQKQVHNKLRHVVMFGWEKGTDSMAIEKIVNSFKALPSKINLIKDFEFGTNNSPENLNKGLTHCFTLTFESAADRDAYLIHPAHKAFVAQLQPGPTAVTVFDYWAHQ